MPLFARESGVLSYTETTADLARFPSSLLTTPSTKATPGPTKLPINTLPAVIAPFLATFFANIYNIERVANSFNELNFKKFSYKNKTIFIDIDEMNYNEAIKFIARYNDYKVLVIGWRNSQEDISWLYNIEIERLINKNIQKIYCIGANAYDIATRIKYADFNEKNIIVSPNIDLVLNEIKNYNLNLYVLADKYYINTIKENK